MEDLYVAACRWQSPLSLILHGSECGSMVALEEAGGRDIRERPHRCHVGEALSPPAPGSVSETRRH